MSLASAARRGRLDSGAAWVVILGSLAALGPLSNDAYLPSWPQIAADLHTTASAVQATLTANLLGLAIGQAIAGPISDAVGRRAPLIVGLSLYTGASLLCAVAPSVWVLVALRLLQGIGGATGIVVGSAIVRDRRSGTAAARLFALLILITGLGPVFGPIAGGQILRFASWSGIFVALAIVGAAALLAVLFLLAESLPPQQRRSGGLAAMPGAMAGLLSDRVFTGYMLASGLAFGAMFAYIAGSPFVLQNLHHLTPQEFSAVFSVNAVGLVAAAQAGGRVVGRTGPRVLLGAGSAASATGALIVLAAVLTHSGLPLLLTGMFILVASVGLVMPNSMALALNDHGQEAGTAAALIGTAQYLAGALVAPLAGVSGASADVPMAVVIAVLAIAGLASFTVLARPRSVPATAASRPAEPVAATDGDK